MVIKKIILLIFLVAVIFISGCKRDITPIIKANSELTIKFNEPNDKKQYVHKEIIIKVGSDKYEKLTDWAKKNIDGWDKTPASYIPGIIVEGKGLEINFTGGYVVVNINDGQYIKKVNEDYKYLIEK